MLFSIKVKSYCFTKHSEDTLGGQILESDFGNRHGARVCEGISADNCLLKLSGDYVRDIRCLRPSSPLSGHTISSGPSHRLGQESSRESIIIICGYGICSSAEVLAQRSSVNFMAGLHEIGAVLVVIGLEDVMSVASAGNTIINDELDNSILCVE